MISKDAVSRLLNTSAVLDIEATVARAVGERIVDSEADLVLDILVNELQLASLTLERIETLLSTNADLLIAFGVALLRGETPLPEEQEHDPEEGDQTEGTGPGESLGLGRGFSLSYVCYLYFLMSADTAPLLRYLDAKRVPDVKRFAGRLRRYYQEATTSLQDRRIVT
jgi:hypothetical protein